MLERIFSGCSLIKAAAASPAIPTPFDDPIPEKIMAIAIPRAAKICPPPFSAKMLTSLS